MRLFKRKQNKNKHKEKKIEYRREELTGARRAAAAAIRRAKPEDFMVYPEHKTLKFMDMPMETLTIWHVSVYSGCDEHIIGHYATRDEAEYVMEDVIRTRALPVCNMPTIRELIERQEVA